MARAGGWRTQGAAIIAAMILLASPARAGCNLSDIFNGVKDTFGALGSCSSACADGVGCGAAAFMTSALGGVSADAGQGAVDSFCSQAEGLTDVNKVVGLLNSVGGAGDQAASVLNSVGSLTSVVKCACETEQGAGSVASDLGACMEDALCWLQDELGLGSCYCTRPPPALANCASIDVEHCASKDTYEKWQDPACLASGSIINTNPNGQNDPYMGPWENTLAITTTPQGTLVQQLPPSAEGTGCEGVKYCFCPAPMKADWQQIPNPDSDVDFYVFACECPDGTHPGATMPNGISSCLCDNTNQPAQFSNVLGMCPPPACPTGQVRLGGVGDCVTPCADPKQGMAFDGSCCNPAQMNTCGQCCPAGTTPDPKSGSCVPAPQPPK